jgi:branched-chain amino acid transport system ATP-binding protein
MERPSAQPSAEAAVAGTIRVAVDPVLTVDHLRVAYGPVVAVNDVNLHVERGSITGLIGPNGAGKTTFIDGLSGFAAAGGDVRLEGDTIANLRPHTRQRRGIARTFQSLELFDDLTVEENLVANCNFSPWAMARDVLLGRQAPPPELVVQLLDIFHLTPLRKEQVSALSHGHRKIVSIARAMASRPSVLLLDEPAAGLDSAESKWLGEQLRSVVRAGISILLVEHDMDLVLSICDYLYVLDFGKLIAQGTCDEVSHNPAVIAAYLGGPAIDTERGAE